MASVTNSEPENKTKCLSRVFSIIKRTCVIVNMEVNFMYQYPSFSVDIRPFVQKRGTTNIIGRAKMYYTGGWRVGSGGWGVGVGERQQKTVRELLPFCFLFFLSFSSFFFLSL